MTMTRSMYPFGRGPSIVLRLTQIEAELRRVKGLVNMLPARISEVTEAQEVLQKGGEGCDPETYAQQTEGTPLGQISTALENAVSGLALIRLELAE